ncbi:MAG: right-handed parallel beta-helix repeat-containing protein [Planctomycetota bacterium]|nr:right-handed parallel beta-helix repeat-containing protein [Planctomycetota bacterium]
MRTLLLILAGAFLAGLHACPAGSAELNADPETLAEVNAQAAAGDTVVLADGNYTTPIAPRHSGEPDKPLVYKAANRHKALFTGEKLNGAVQLENKAFVVIEGIAAQKVQRFIVSEGSRHITVNDCNFEDSSQGSWEGCRFRSCGDGIVFTNNRVTGGNDLLAIWKGQHHRVENNFFGDASHTGLVLIAVQRSAIRGNRLLNREWKCMEVFSERAEPAQVSRYNLIEKNRFEFSPASSIQYAGNDSILRRNVFWRTRTGMNFAHYLGRAKTPEAWYNSGNRFYHNVVADCGNSELNDRLIGEADAAGHKVAEPKKLGETIAYGIVFATNINDSKRPYGDQALVNNILFRNGTGKGTDKIAPTVQVSFDWDATPAVASFFNNCFGGGQPGDKLFYWLDADREKPPLPNSDVLKAYEERYASAFARNIEADPLFVDPDRGDFRLKPGSPCLDAGGPLTTAVEKGAGRTIQVADARFFCDGFGIVEPDVIRVAGIKAKLVQVDYAKNTLTLDAELAWEAGAPLTLDYAGKGPDVGAFEEP